MGLYRCGGYKKAQYYFGYGGADTNTFDLGFIPTKCNIVATIRWYSLNLAGWCRCYIYGSNDGSNWTTLFDSDKKTPGDNSTGSYNYVKSFSGYRYIRVRMTGDNGTMHLCMASVSAFMQP